MTEPPAPAIVYRLIPAGDWVRAQAEGAVPYGDKDRADGFFHLSTGEQALATAARYFSGRADLLALEIDAAMLGEQLKMERSTGGAFYPHLYGDLPLAAILCARPLAWRDGAFRLAEGRAS